MVKATAKKATRKATKPAVVPVAINPLATVLKPEQHRTAAGTCRSSTAGYTHTAIMRWLGHAGHSVNTVAGVMALLGVHTRLNTVRNQVGSGRAGLMSYHGPVPGVGEAAPLPVELSDELTRLAEVVKAMPFDALQAKVSEVFHAAVPAAQRQPSLRVVAPAPAPAPVTVEPVKPTAKRKRK